METSSGKEAVRQALLKTSGGREIIQQEFGVTVVDRKEDTRPVVVILVPTHKEPQPETGNALNHLIQASKDYAHVIMRPSVGSSVVHWVRNYLLAQLYKSGTPFDYVLFCDDDMVPPPDALIKLLEKKVDVIGAVCTVRQDPPLPNARYYNQTMQCYQTADIDRGGVWNLGAIGTGFMLLSRKVLEDVGEYTLKQRYFREHLGMSEEKAAIREREDRARAEKDNNKFWFEFLKDPKAGELGEDISFCLKAKECGYEIFGDSTIIVGHVGNYAFSLEDYWAYRDAAVQKGLVVPIVQQAKDIPQYNSETRISLLVPTRGRPDNIVRLLQSLHETSHVMPDVILRIDDDDEESKSALEQIISAGENVSFIGGKRTTMTAYWNEIAGLTPADVLMFAADDICFRTKGWDSLVRKTFDEHPDKMIFVHGEDGYWGNRFGTHGFLHRKWVDALGYVLPPYFSSDFGDTWINDVANMLGRRVFLPILIEHMHPLWGKANMDKTYQERMARGEKDGVKALYDSMARKRAEDVEKIKAAMMQEAVPVG